jgi:hypothetical protein
MEGHGTVCEVLYWKVQTMHDREKRQGNMYRLRQQGGRIKRLKENP